ncbi:hypothetical protein TNCV_684631 [Trichonephila clavipes]|nr:hypothetical protein TNCV_684631 [Trichonephila clavipes]
MLKSMFPAVVMTTSLVERALYVKLFHPNKGNAPAAVREFLRKRNLRRGPISVKGIRTMIKRLKVQHGTGRKRVTRLLVDVVKAAVDTQSQVIGGGSACAVSRQDSVTSCVAIHQ